MIENEQLPFFAEWAEWNEHSYQSSTKLIILASATKLRLAQQKIVLYRAWNFGVEALRSPSSSVLW